MSNPYVGEIQIFGFNFPPRGWSFCNGQILSISQNTALFSILGATYGGNGQSNFALPNFQSRVPLSFGQGSGLSNRALGEVGGSENVTLLSTEMPPHGHSLAASSAPATSTEPGNAVLAQSGDGLVAYTPTLGTNPPVPLDNAVGISGGSQPHNNLMPLLTLNFCIALQGVFPSPN